MPRMREREFIEDRGPEQWKALLRKANCFQKELERGVENEENQPARSLWGHLWSDLTK